VITFAVVGHDEAATVANALGQAMEAAETGDRVWFVDSASTDQSAAIADSLRAEVISAPLGKGMAMSRAIELCETGHICFLDADIESSSVNIAAALRRALEATGADMVVGEFAEPAKPTRSTTTAIYGPLLEAFFPEAMGRCGATPLSGFRMLSLERPIGQLPDGFGVEAHLDVAFAVAGRTIEVADVGVYRGPVRPSRDVARDAARAILDLAEVHGRLAPADRPPWDAWARSVVEVIEKRPEGGRLDGFHARLAAAVARRPLADAP
jgi:glycosyltransferase involved in cell wall biosynthesis